MPDVLTGKLRTVLHLSLNDREGTGPSRTQWGKKKSYLALYVSTREKKHTLTCNLGTTENVRVLKLTLGRKQLALWTFESEQGRRDSTASPILLISLVHNIHPTQQ